MTDARTEILQRIRAGLAAGPAGEAAPLPDVLATAERAFDAATFVERARTVGVEVTELAEGGDVAGAVMDVLRSIDARRVAVSDHEAARQALAGYDGELVEPDAPRDALFACDAGVTTAQLGIAETGTLVLHSNSERHRLTSLVPEAHIALLRRHTIVPTLDDALIATPILPRCTTMITGPSRTADIELELVVGVHGPRTLHIILC